jgi:DNA-binding NarL/FixJ family response regulator
MKQKDTIRKVLLIDDDEDEYFIFREVLQLISTDLRLMYIHGFLEGWNDAEGELPDIAFIDINMPKEDGFMWVRKLRARGYSFPIVMFSNSSAQNDIDMAYQVGANLYLQKASDFKALTTSVSKILGLDWIYPEKVRTEHFKDGKYLSFFSER